MDIVAGQAIWSREHHQVTACSGDRIAQAVQSWSAQGGPTEAVVTKHQLVVDLPRVVGTPCPQAFERLLTGLLLGLSLGRDPKIQGDAHGLPPGR